VRITERLRSRLQGAVLEPFSHGSEPLATTLDHMGDPGLFGPESITWPVMGDIAALIGGLRALLIQFAHPEVAAGMVDHSLFERDPLGRISRTTHYVASTSFGAMPEVEQAVIAVRRAHRPVRGESHRAVTYTADDADLSSWVHNALSDSFLASYRTYGPSTLTEEEADQFAAEQQRLGTEIGADTVPATAAALASWISDRPVVGPSPGAKEVVPFIARPPAGPLMVLGYIFLYWGACAIIPHHLRTVLGVRKYPGAIVAGRMVVRILRWAMGSSPAWEAALIRSGAEMPAEIVFIQPLPGSRTES
jgi:uncharacterized protein (DUF2236 family)